MGSTRGETPGVEALLDCGLTHQEARRLVKVIATLAGQQMPSTELWHALSRNVLQPQMPFALQQLLYEWAYADWDPAQGPPPAWLPTAAQIAASNIRRLMTERGMTTYEQLFQWSVTQRDEFWQSMIRQLDIRLQTPASSPTDLVDVTAPRWLIGASLNIVDSCFNAPASAAAILHRAEGGQLETMTYRELECLTNRVANGLVAAGFRPGDRIAVFLPMTAASVATYLGIVKAGCTVVSIAESFAADEVRVRLELTDARAIFTQDEILRGGRVLPLFAKAVAADAPAAIVVGRAGSPHGLRQGDHSWESFLSDEDSFGAVGRAPSDHSNILFSSGTTGQPKAIVWSHTSPIKSAADAYLHHDIRPGDVLAWPTSLGWMMGPWLIYASLVNHAAMALFDGAPTGREFGQLVQDAKVTMLGVVPSLVRAWRRSACMSGLDWQQIRAFSSTGESSNADDMLYLMALAGYRPIIEYCGGTEISGSYLTGTMVQPAAPTTFTTPAMGLDLVLLDDEGMPADIGEAFLLPPSIGLSTELLHQDHQQVYFSDCPSVAGLPRLRRHGDQVERLADGRYRVHGRVDDTMNLGGIKVSSVEIERVLNTLEGVSETAAIAIQQQRRGPSGLVVYVVLFADSAASAAAGRSTEPLQDRCQRIIRERLNPLFRVEDVVVVDALPRTASNKTLRRVLRAEYEVGLRGD